MKKNRLAYGVLPALALLAAGCRRDPADAVAFAVVDDHPITAAFVRDTVLISARLAELAGQPISEAQFPRWGNSMAMRITPGLLSGYLWEREIRQRKIVPNVDDTAKVLRNYNRMAATNLASIADFKPLMGDLYERFARQAERECLFAAYSRLHFTTNVTEADLARYFRAKTNELRRAARIDAEAHRSAEETYKKLCDGADWDETALAVSEDKLLDDENAEYYKEWGNFRPVDFSNDALGFLLPSLKKGQFSRPVESDEGMLIVRVNDIEEDVYSCSRILFRMAAPVEVMEPEEAKSYLSKKKARDSQLALLRELKAKANIKYPLGTNFVYHIWNVPDSRQSPREGRDEAGNSRTEQKKEN